MFRDIFLFVSELASKLSHGLTLTIEHDTVEKRALLTDYNDFAAYFHPLMTVIREQVTVEGPILIPFCDVGYCISY